MVRSSAGSVVSINTLGQKLVAAQVFTTRLNLMLPTTVNFTAKVIDGRILIKNEHRAVAVRKMPTALIQTLTTVKAMHYLDQAALVYHKGICSSLKIPCSWSPHKTFLRRCPPLAVIALIIMADFHSLIIKQITIKWPKNYYSKK